MADRKSGTSATQNVYEQLRADVLSSRLAPGQRLKIAALSAEHDVSPGAVREALSRLTSEGLVIAEPQRGFRVAPISAFELKDLTTVRVEIESLCLRRSIEHGDADWEARLKEVFRRLSETPERVPEDSPLLDPKWAKLHHEYHETLVSACDSPWLLRLREMLYAQSERYRRLSWRLSDFNRDLNSEHRQILDAALSRNAELAVSLLSSHLLVTTQILLDNKVVDSEPENLAAAE